MTIQEKVLFIINLLELSDRQVGEAINKSSSTVTHKRLKIGSNKFSEIDFKRLKDNCLEKLNKIQELQ